jgi:hypothetical protein
MYWLFRNNEFVCFSLTIVCVLKKGMPLRQAVLVKDLYGEERLDDAKALANTLNGYQAGFIKLNAKTSCHAFFFYDVKHATQFALQLPLETCVTETAVGVSNWTTLLSSKMCEFVPQLDLSNVSRIQQHF